MSSPVSNYTGNLSGQSWVKPPSMKTAGKPVFLTYSFPTKMSAEDRKSWPSDIPNWRKFSKTDIKEAKAALKP
jgi:hypothetical protein